MPVWYQIDTSLRCIFVTLEGIVTDQELLEGQHNMFNEPLFVGSYSRLVDARTVTKLLVTANCVRHVAKEAIARGLGRVSLVANTDFVYAMMRMYEGYAFEAECFVTRDRDAALAWLFTDR